MIYILFFCVALLYSSVGFGGGSSYTAILAMTDLPFQMIPVISLVCNMCVVGMGCIHFRKAGYFRKDLCVPLVLASVPMVFLGSLTLMTEQLFFFNTRLCFAGRIDTDVKECFVG